MIEVTSIKTIQHIHLIEAMTYAEDGACKGLKTYVVGEMADGTFQSMIFNEWGLRLQPITDEQSLEAIRAARKETP